MIIFDHLEDSEQVDRGGNPAASTIWKQIFGVELPNDIVSMLENSEIGF